MICDASLLIALRLKLGLALSDGDGSYTDIVIVLLLCCRQGGLLRSNALYYEI